MTPAAKCEGCEKTWRTQYEPASNQEMTALLNATARHKADIADKVGISVMESLAESLGGLAPTRSQTSIHKVRFTYFDKTPAEGFEKAEIVMVE